MLKIHITSETMDELRQTLGGDAEMAQQWVEIYKQAAEEQLAEALVEQLGVSIANHQSQHHAADGLGQCMMRIGAKLNAWLHQYAPGFVYDEVFIRKLVADNQHMCLKPTYLRKAQIIRPDFTQSIIPVQAAA